MKLLSHLARAGEDMHVHACNAALLRHCQPVKLDMHHVNTKAAMKEHLELPPVLCPI
jgi:hypothetical protein